MTGDTKSERITFRITEEDSERIERLIQQGKFLSQSDFGRRAISTMLDLAEKGEHYLAVVVEFLHYFIWTVRDPTYKMPKDIQMKFNLLFKKLVVDDELAGQT